jgi:hypothetical protein
MCTLHEQSPWLNYNDCVVTVCDIGLYNPGSCSNVYWRHNGRSKDWENHEAYLLLTVLYVKLEYKNTKIKCILYCSWNCILFYKMNLIIHMINDTQWKSEAGSHRALIRSSAVRRKYFRYVHTLIVPVRRYLKLSSCTAVRLNILGLHGNPFIDIGLAEYIQIPVLSPR